jgi:hypothetical protein
MGAARSAPPRRVWRAATIPAVVLALSTAVTSAVLAATALIMGGTGHPLSVPQDTPTFITDYVNGADSSYIAPSGLCSGGSPGCTLLDPTPNNDVVTPVDTPTPKTTPKTTPPPPPVNTKPTGLLPALSVDPPKKPPTPTIGKPVGPGLGGLNMLVSSIAGAFKNPSTTTPSAAGDAAGSTGDK